MSGRPERTWKGWNGGSSRVSDAPGLLAALEAHPEFHQAVWLHLARLNPDWRPKDLLVAPWHGGLTLVAWTDPAVTERFRKRLEDDALLRRDKRLLEREAALEAARERERERAQKP